VKRNEAVRRLVTTLREHLVVCYAGAACEELFAGGDEDRFLYVLGSMGLSSSIGLGLGLATRHPVVAFEGDGSLLMNLGTLITTAQRAPAGFVLAIVDNGQHASTGGQKTATSSGVDVGALARASGWRDVRAFSSMDDIEDGARSFPRDGAILVHLRVEPGDGPRRVVDLAPAELVARAKRVSA
jgi:sulfopyruvate decarboxylase subunit beta